MNIIFVLNVLIETVIMKIMIKTIVNRLQNYQKEHTFLIVKIKQYIIIPIYLYYIIKNVIHTNIYIQIVMFNMCVMPINCSIL